MSWLKKGPPSWAKNAVPSLNGWRHPKTGELIDSRSKITQEELDAYLGVNTPKASAMEVTMEVTMEVATEAPAQEDVPVPTEAPTEAPAQEDVKPQARRATRKPR